MTFINLDYKDYIDWRQVKTNQRQIKDVQTLFLYGYINKHTQLPKQTESRRTEQQEELFILQPLSMVLHYKVKGMSHDFRFKET